ncbi:MAG: SpoIIE family protein phosphatase [Lacunisphaera sp.]|nr:SpoIIE family protein phosphatase [Lacunisphaera sp.]
MSGPSPVATPQFPADAHLDSEILRMLMEAIPDRIYFKDLQSRFVRVNRAFTDWHGLVSPDEVIGKTDFDLFADVHAKVALAEEQEIIRSGRPLIAKMERLTRRDGTVGWGSATKLAWRDAAGAIIGTFGITRDATAIKQAEEKVTAERNLLRTIIDHLPARIFVKDAASRYLLNNQAHLDLLGVVGQAEALGKTTSDFFPTERGRQALADDQQVLATGNPVLSQEKSDFGTEGQVHWSLTTKVPLRDQQGKITGLVGISHDITARKRTEQELQRRTGEMEADLSMARQIQEAFFPREYPVFPAGVPAEASELRFAHRYLPAATLGGDFFDILPLSDTQCGVLICDVMGHGVRAGLLTALIRGVVEEFAPHAAHPALVLAEINRGLMPIIRQTGQPVFATAFYGVIDTVAATLSFANGGHPAPLLLRGDTRRVDSLAFANPEPAAGLMEEFLYSSRSVPFQPGDTLLAYTDGFFEASNAAGAMFGETRLRDLLAQKSGQSGAELIDRLIREVIAFTGQSNFDDDLCALAVESTGNSCTVRPAATYQI